MIQRSGDGLCQPPCRLRGGTWEDVGRPGWDYLVGVERENSLILSGAQIYSKLGEEGHSPGRAAWLVGAPHSPVPAAP